MRRAGMSETPPQGGGVKSSASSSNNHHHHGGASLSSTASLRPSRNSASSPMTSNNGGGSDGSGSLRPPISAKQKKRRLFYLLLIGVFVFQSIIFPWFVAPNPVSHEGTTSQQNLAVSPPDAAGSITALRRVQHVEEHLADGTFNEFPMYLRTNDEASPLFSTVHCAGETHNPETAWMYRSCEFTNLCLDTQTKEFFVVESPIEQALQQHRVPQSYVSTELSAASFNATSDSTKNITINLTVALGGINPRWVGNDFNQGIHKVRWFPKTVSKGPSKYYVLDSRVALVPFHSFAAHNVGHMLWDDFLPIYTLLQIFGWNDLIGGGSPGGGPAVAEENPNQKQQQQQHQQQQLLLLRVDTLPLLYGTCEMRRKKGKKCAENFEKFLPLLGINPKTFSTVKKINFQPKNLDASDDSSATWVCARHAMAGLGMLTDHGLKDHGWLMPKETHSVQNTAKGALLYQFRNALLQNLGMPLAPPPNAPLKIVLSAHSSADPPRDNNFINQQNALSRSFPDIPVHTVELAKLGLREQVELVSQTRIFVSTCGGGAMTATFLPKGATLILYYDDDGGYDFAHDFNLTGDPAFLDWDLFNNMVYLRVHWLPIGTMNTQEGFRTLAFLIRHELQVMESGV